MPYVAFYPTLITTQVNQTGSASQIQDSPDAPDNDWILATDVADSGSFVLEYDPATFPAEVITAASNWRFAIFVRNSRDSGRAATWGGTVHVNGSNQVFTRIEVPQEVNVNTGGVKQEAIQATPGGVPSNSSSSSMTLPYSLTLRVTLLVWGVAVLQR